MGLKPRRAPRKLTDNEVVWVGSADGFHLRRVELPVDRAAGAVNLIARYDITKREVTRFFCASRWPGTDDLMVVELLVYQHHPEPGQSWYDARNHFTANILPEMFPWIRELPWQMQP